MTISCWQVRVYREDEVKPRVAFAAAALREGLIDHQVLSRPPRPSMPFHALS